MKKRIKKNRLKTFKRADLINNNLLDLDKKKNSIIKKFLYKTISQDFEFNKLQLKINNRIYDSSIFLKRANKKIWKK